MGKLKNSMLEYQQAQFDQLFGALDTIGATTRPKVQAFISNHAREFTPSQIEIIAHHFDLTESEKAQAIAEFEKTI